MNQSGFSYHELGTDLLTGHLARAPLDATERSTAVLICDQAFCRMDAKRLLLMCGLLRRETSP